VWVTSRLALLLHLPGQGDTALEYIHWRWSASASGAIFQDMSQASHGSRSLVDANFGMTTSSSRLPPSLYSGAKGQEALYAIPKLQEIVNRHPALKPCCVHVKWTAAFGGFILAPPLSLLMPDPTGQGYERWSRGQCLWSHALKCSEPWVSNHLIRQMCHKCSTIVSADRYDMPGSGNRVVRITTLQDLGCGKSPSDSEWALKMGFPQRAAPPR